MRRCRSTLQVGAAALVIATLLTTAAFARDAGATSMRADTPPTPAQRQMAAIVHEWSDRLNARDFDGLARLFALPAILIQGSYEYRLPTRADVAKWHSLLPCGGTILSISYAGRFAAAVFRLTNRGKTKCDAPGSLAAARFEIVRNKIVSWEQIAVPAKKTSAPIA